MSFGLWEKSMVSKILHTLLRSRFFLLAAIHSSCKGLSIKSMTPLSHCHHKVMTKWSVSFTEPWKNTRMPLIIKTRRNNCRNLTKRNCFRCPSFCKKDQSCQSQSMVRKSGTFSREFSVSITINMMMSNSIPRKKSQSSTMRITSLKFSCNRRTSFKLKASRT